MINKSSCNGKDRKVRRDEQRDQGGMVMVLYFVSSPLLPTLFFLCQGQRLFLLLSCNDDSLNLGEWEEQSCKDIAGQPIESTIDFSSYRNDFNNLCRHQTNSDYNSMVQKTDSPSLALPLPSSSTFDFNSATAYTEMMMLINSDDNNQFQVPSVESQISQRKLPFYTRFCSFHFLLIYLDDRGFNVL